MQIPYPTYDQNGLETVHNYTHTPIQGSTPPPPLLVHGINEVKEPRGVREKFSAYPSHHVYFFYSEISQVPTTQSRRDLETVVLLWNGIKCFPSTLSWRNLLVTQHWICVWRKLGQENHVIIVRSSSAVFKTFSVEHTETKNRRFHISPGWRTVPKSSIFMTN